MFAGGLSGGDKGAGDIFVFGKADGVRDARFVRIANGGFQPRVRHAYDDIRLYGVLLGKVGARSLAAKADRCAVDHRVGTGKIDVFKYAKPLGEKVAFGIVEVDAVFIHDGNLPGAQIAHDLGADGVQRAGFGGKDDLAVFRRAVAQRSEPVRVAHGDQLLRRADDQ